MEKKPWWKSQTIWSLIGAGVSLVAPKYVDVIPPLVGHAAEIIFLISAGFGRSKPDIKEVTFFSQKQEGA